MDKKIKGVRVGSSDERQRRQELMDNHEKLQRMIADGWEIKSAKVRRPRIKKENFKIVMVFNKPMKLTIQEYNDHFLMAFGK